MLEQCTVLPTTDMRQEKERWERGKSESERETEERQTDRERAEGVVEDL